MTKDEKENLLNERQQLKEDFNRVKGNFLYSKNPLISESEYISFNFGKQYKNVLINYIQEKIDKIDEKLGI